MPILSARGLRKSYHKDRIELPVLRDIDLEVTPGKITTLVGRSGSGKSTLMHLLATLDRPDEGEIWFGNQRLDNASRRRRDQFRNRDIGVIFQFYHLLPELSAIENVMAPAMIGHSALDFIRHRKSLREHAESMLERVGLQHRMKHRPTEMSGGEMQRAAIARALMSGPSLLLADEPTGNLDTETGEEILKLLRGLNETEGLTILMITHDDSIADNADVQYRMIDGMLENQRLAKVA
ncbi:MAG: ABC transporter ATP-binding protein [Planctomycetota bacterium]